MAIEFKNEVQMVPVEKVRPNPWNPAKLDDEGLIQKAIDSFRRIGFCGAIWVREKKQGESLYEIIDGEHRYTALTRLEESQVPIISLGDVPDEEAKLLTLNFNLIRGDMVAMDVAAIVADLNEQLGTADLLESLALGEPEVEALVEAAGMDWQAFKTENPSTRTLSVFRRVFAFPQDAYAVVKDLLAKAQKYYGVDTEEAALAEVCKAYLGEEADEDGGASDEAEA